MPARGIYVETIIAAPLERVWHLTQEPAEHEQWDLRFSTITYLPRSEGEPQQFLYTTRIGFGMAIAGNGESTGTVESPTRRTSALRFWSESALSLIRKGQGYWKYQDLGKSVRFLTWYDYEVRFGALGKFVDAIAFRPIIGWATAWSFDRLRLRATRGTPAAATLHATLIYTLARATVCGVWFYHGLIPKLLFHDADELALLSAQHLSQAWLPVAGYAEIALALLGIFLWRWRGYFTFTAVLMVVALIGVGTTAPVYLSHAFNPFTLNSCVVALCFCGFFSHADAAFAGRCLRRPTAKTQKTEVR